MADLSPNTILRRASSLGIRVDPDGQIAVRSPEGEAVCGAAHGLAVLDVFSTARTIGDAVARLRQRVRGAQDWIDLTNTIIELHQGGILLDDGETGAEIDREARGFAAPEVHISMLNDRAQTAGFLAAIQETVKPGDVVVDVGTGTGVLAIAAARAGARHVYAIEASSIGHVANLMFQANGLADRITLLEGRSTHIDLPEKADVLISETIGSEPLREQVLETFLDARLRYLNPDARYLPERLSLFGVPVEIPATDLSSHTFTPETAERWRNAYGMDFSPLAVVAASPGQSFLAQRTEARQWQRLSEPIQLWDVDLRRHPDAAVRSTVSGTATSSGLITGLTIFFELHVSPSVRLCTDPSTAAEHSNWRNPVEILPVALKVHPGDLIEVTYRYGVPGQKVEVRTAPVRRYR
ncbi:MAG: 50S ribosomal protein L11 methyltransferase [Acidobacteriia bacterium]|nr:50S ribosomal protein L11 methyltransferase [Terriglobia bacterium]